MVYKKKRTTRKYAKKRYTRKTRITKTPKTHYGYFKLSMNAPIAFTATGGGSLALRMSMSNPQRGMNVNSGGYTTMQEWTDISQLYDQYRVTYVKIRFYPSQQNNTTLTYLPFHIFHDYDDADSSDATVAEACQNNNMRCMNLVRPWIYKQRIMRKYASGGVGSSPVNNGWFDTASLPQVGAIKGIATGLTGSAQYGYLMCNMWIKCRDRR